MWRCGWALHEVYDLRLKRCGTQRSEVRMYALRGDVKDVLDERFSVKIVCFFLVMFAVWWKLFIFVWGGVGGLTVEELAEALHQNCGEPIQTNTSTSCL